MQDAIAFGYCKRHQATTVDPAVFNQYKGVYVNDDKSGSEVLIFVEKNKLYLKWQAPGALPTELIPQSKTEYFMVEYEWILFTFKKEDSKVKMVAIDADKKEYPFTRKE